MKVRYQGMPGNRAQLGALFGLGKSGMQRRHAGDDGVEANATFVE
jgi:hypothetical protein